MSAIKQVGGRSKLWSYAATIGVAALLLSALAFSMVKAQSDGGDAGSGGIGGSCTGYCTDNGFGWKKYSVDSEGPRGNNGRGFVLNSPKTWTQVKDTCKGFDTESVWIFVAYHYDNGLSVGLDYLATEYSQDYINNNYRGDASIGDVKGYYDEAVELGIASTENLTWGTNIGWFCYTSNPPWSLAVSVSADKKTAEVGSKITWTHTVKNEGPNKTNKIITWHSQDRGDWPNNPGTDWTIAKGLENDKSKTDTSTYIVQASDFGKTLCRATSAKPSTNTNSWWVESGRACVSIVKKPKVQVLGADLLVGRDSLMNSGRVSKVDTSVSAMSNGRYYGSWAEYGIVPTGGVSGMASGSGYVGGATTNSLCSLSILTFVNANASGGCSEGVIGKYRQDSVVPDVASRFEVDGDTKTLSGSVDIRNDNLSGLYTSKDTTLRLTSADVVELGRSVIINAPNTTVTIGSNIQYSNEKFKDFTQIPQVVIIAKNIIVQDSVTVIDSWLVAIGRGSDGNINTCGAGAVGQSTPLTRSTCVNQLVVNGPVAANHLHLRRTFGSDSLERSSLAAEIFNLRGDAYLWATANNRELSTIRTVSTKELPPRF